MSVLNTINEKESKDTNRLSLDKLEGGKSFKITSNFKPSGDQPAAIKEFDKKWPIIWFFLSNNKLIQNDFKSTKWVATDLSFALIEKKRKLC